MPPGNDKLPRVDDLRQRIERLREEHATLYLESRAARERAQTATDATRSARRRRWQDRFEGAAARYERLLDDTDLFDD